MSLASLITEPLASQPRIRAGIATRVVAGQTVPAWQSAPHALRQSHIDKWREIYRAAREPVELTDDPTGAVDFLVNRQNSRLGIALVVLAAVLLCMTAVIAP